MRSDLLFAQASLDWAIANFPPFEERLNLWLKDNVKTVLHHTGPDMSHDLIIAVEKEPLPLTFSVEVGILLNALRSALDMVAYAVFKRDLLLFPKDVYFPFADGAEKWASGDYKGKKFIAQLGGTERRIFENLKPYKGGNDSLYTLHWLDISRKHRQLLDVTHAPRKLRIIGNFKTTEFIPIKNAEGWIEGAEGETVLGLWAKGAAKPKLGYTPDILVTDTELAFQAQIMPMLGEFRRQTQMVIDAFDY